MLHRVSNTEESQLLQKMIIEDAQRELLLESPPTDAMSKETTDRNRQLHGIAHLEHVYRVATIISTNRDPLRHANRQNIREAMLLARLLNHANRGAVKTASKGDKKIRRTFQMVGYEKFKALVKHVNNDINASLKAANQSTFYADIVKGSLEKLASYCRREERCLNAPLNDEIAEELILNHEAFSALRDQMKKILGIP